MSMVLLAFAPDTNFHDSRFLFRLEKNSEALSSIDVKEKLKSIIGTADLKSDMKNRSAEVDTVLNRFNPQEQLTRFFDKHTNIEFAQTAKKMAAEGAKYFDASDPRSLETFYADLQKIIADKHVGKVSESEIKAYLPAFADSIQALYLSAAEIHQESITAKQKEVTSFLENKDTVQHFVDQFDYRQPLRDQVKSYLQSQPFWGDLSDADKKKIAAGLSEKFTDFYTRLEQRFQTEVKNRTEQANTLLEKAEQKYAKEEFLEQPIEDLMASEAGQLHDLLKHLPTEYHAQLKTAIVQKSDIVRERFERKRADLALQRINKLTLDKDWLKDNSYENFSDFMQLFGQTAGKEKRIYFAEPVWQIVEGAAVDKFQELHREYLEKADRIPRDQMAEGWKKMQDSLKNPDKSYQNLGEFTTDFIQQYFPNQAEDVQKYLQNHPNFNRSVERFFQTYQRQRSEKVKEQNQAIESVLGPLKNSPYPYAQMIQSSILRSFQQADSLTQKDLWLNELKTKYIPKYRQAMDQLDGFRSTAKTSFGKLKHSRQAQALETKMKQTVKVHLSTWSKFDGNFKGPHELASAVSDQMKELATLEKNWDKKLTEVRQQINGMSLADIKGLDDPQKRTKLVENISAFAKEFNVWTDADVWNEVKDEFGQKMLQLHAELKTGKGEAAEAKALAETLKGLKAIEQMNINDSSKFDVEDDSLMDFATFRKAFDVQMPEAAWLSKGKKAFDTKALALHREFTNKRREHFKQKIGKLDFKTNIKEQTELVDIKAFRRHPDLAVKMTDAEWQQWGKAAFDTRFDRLYQDFRAERETMYRQKIATFSLDGLSDVARRDPNNLDITHFRKQFDIWMSDDEWGRFGKNAFDQKINTLFKELLDRHQSGDESVRSPEAKKAMEAIDNISINDLDNTKVYTDFTEFKRQPFFQERISFDDKIWAQVKDKFQLKAAALFAEHQEKMSPQNRLRDLGQKYNLSRMETIPAHSVQDFEKKIVRLEELLKKNPLSVKKFIEYNERERMPFLLDMLGEMHAGDMRELLTDMPESRIMQPAEFTELMFGNQRRQYVLGEAIRKNSYNWYWFTTKNKDIPLDKDGQIKEIEALTDEQVAAPDLEGVAMGEQRTENREPSKEESEEVRDESLEEGELDVGNDHIVPDEDLDNENKDDLAEDIDEKSDEDLEDSGEEDEDELEEDDEQGTENREQIEDDVDQDRLEDRTEDADEQITENTEQTVDGDALDVGKDHIVPETDDTETDDTETVRTADRRRPTADSLPAENPDELLDHSEDGNEDSLTEDWEDELLPGTNPQQFADQYIKQGMQLGQVLRRLHRYIEFLAGVNLEQSLNMSDDLKRTYLEHPHVLFQQLADFGLAQPGETIKKISFKATLSNPTLLTLECIIEQRFGLVQKSFGATVAV